MVTISGFIRKHTDNSPLVGVLPVLEKGDLTTFVPFGAGKTSASTSGTGGFFEVSYEPEEGTYGYVRLRFADSDGTALEVVTSSDALVWDRTQPPTDQLEVWLAIPPREADRAVDDGGPTTTPDVVAGTVRDSEGELRAGVQVRIFGRANLGERLLATGTTLDDGAFVLDIQGSEAQSLRLEFGPVGDPVEAVSGVVEWMLDDPPAAFEYTLDLAPDPPASSFVELRGTVRRVDGTPLPAVAPNRYPIRVRVLSRTLGQADSELGRLSPGSDGSYFTTMSAPSSGLNFVVVCEAEIPAGSDQWEELTRSRLIAGAPGLVTVDLSVTDDRLRTRSQKDSLSKVEDDLTTTGVKPDEVTDGDLELLSEKHSVPRDQVERHVAAMRLKKEVELLDEGQPMIPLEIYDALLAMGFPRTLRPFCVKASRASVVEDALRSAVRSQVLPTSAIESLSQLVVDLTSLLGLYDRQHDRKDALFALIRFVADTAALSDTDIETLVDRWHDRSSPDQFWHDLETAPPAGWTEMTIEAVRRAITILDVTFRQPETAQAFQGQNAEAPASHAAEVGLAGWKDLTGGLPEEAIPAWVSGTTLEDRRTAWAEVVYRRAEARFPWPALRGDMLRAMKADPNQIPADLAETETFLNAQIKRKWFEASPVEFDLAGAYIPAFEPAPSAAVAEHLSALQRLFALIPRLDAWTWLLALWKAGFRSARDISRLGEERFIHLLEQAHGSTVPRTLALDIWQRARHRTQRAQNYWRSNHPAHESSHSRFTHSSEESTSSDGEVKPEAAGDVAKLYVQALCGCEHCQSVLSPSAYFVDTLFWLQDRQILDPLLAVRPDLEHLELDCENTETALPYSDLLIEILEQIVADAPISDLPHATEGETSALVAYPEHVDRPEAAQAYGVLKTAVWPRILPYHLALDEVRTYLDAAGVSHSVLIDTLNDLADTPVSATDRAVVELGGTTQGAAMILAGGGPNPEVWWGFEAPTTGFREIVYLLPELLERGQIDDFDLVLDLMRTRYLNADARLGVVLSPDAPDGVDACDVANLALLRDRAPAESEPDFVKPDDWLFTRMAAFLRLLDWTGWAPLTLDKALYALGVEGARPGTAAQDAAPDPGVQITSERLQGLWAIDALLAHTGLSPEELCSWWTGLDTYLDRQNREGRPIVPLYDRRFLDPFVANKAAATAFTLNASRTELATTDSASLVDTEPVALAGALRVDIGQMRATAAMLQAKGVTLHTDITSLWHLFRWTSLSRAARLSIEQVEQHIQLTDLDPFGDTPSGVPDPTVAWRWFQALDELRRHDLSVGAIAWVFGHVGSEVAKLAPTDAEIEALLAQLKEALLSLRAELSDSQADEPTVRAALQEIGLGASDIDAIVAFLTLESEPLDDHVLDVLEGWVDDLPALKQDLSELLDLDARMSALLERMQAATLVRRQRELVIGALEAEFQGMTRAHLDVLDRVDFSGLRGFDDPIAALHRPARPPYSWSLEDARDVTAAEAGHAHEAVHLVAKLAYLVSALSLDVATLEEWLTVADAVGAPSLIDLPVVEDPSRLDGLWASLGPALKWFDLDRRFQRPAPAARDIRAALRTGSARAALAMIAERQEWDLAPVGPLAKAMGVASARLTVLPGEVPPTASITIDGHRIEATSDDGQGEPSAGYLLTNLGLEITAAIPWLAAHTEDVDGNSPVADPSDAVALVLVHDDSSPLHAPFDVITSALAVEQALHEAAPFGAFLERWELLAQLGLDLPTALNFVTADPSRERASDARRVARNKYPSDATWSSVGRELRDGIRRRQQAALYAAVRALPNGPKDDAEFYARYFVDPGMDPCMLTTRLVLAIGSVQTYVNRCLLGLVTNTSTGKPVAFSSDEEEEWRGWRSTYRMWEAARKVFMYPENWLEPSLRVERSPEYDALEARLQTEALDPGAAEEAFRTYLTDILPYGNPLLACMCEDAEHNLHILARVGTSADQLIYRTAERLSEGRYRWSAWERLPFPVPLATGTQLVMITNGNTVLVAWSTVVVLEDEDKKNKKRYDNELRVHFAVSLGGHWSTPQECLVKHYRGVEQPVPELLMYKRTDNGRSGVHLLVGSETWNSYQYAELKWSPTLRRFVERPGPIDILQAPRWAGLIPTRDARFRVPVEGQFSRQVSAMPVITLAQEQSSVEFVTVVTASSKGEPLRTLIPLNNRVPSRPPIFAVVHVTRSYLVRSKQESDLLSPEMDQLDGMAI